VLSAHARGSNDGRWGKNSLRGDLSDGLARTRDNMKDRRLTKIVNTGVCGIFEVTADHR